MITSLTPEQIARLPDYAAAWTQIGLSTEPADRPAAERAIAEIYRAGGLAPPKRIVWCGSPVSQAYTRAIVMSGAIGRDSIGAAVGSSVKGSVRDSVFASVGDSVASGVRDSIWDGVAAGVGATVASGVWVGVRDGVRDSVLDRVWRSASASVRASVWRGVGASGGASIRDGVAAGVGASIYGQHDAAWLSAYNYCDEVLGLRREVAPLSGLMDLARSAGWALPHLNICWVSERPRLLSRDGQGRLHSLVGPSLEYPDGWAIYAIHGVRVPRWVVESPSDITPAKIDAETNAEIRRVMTEQYGVGRYLTNSGAEVIDTYDDTGPIMGLRGATLYRKGEVLAVRVYNSTLEIDGTRKEYFLAVHPELRPLLDDNGSLGARQALTVRNAVASTFGLRGEEYAPQVET